MLEQQQWNIFLRFNFALGPWFLLVRVNPQVKLRQPSIGAQQKKFSENFGKIYSLNYKNTYFERQEITPIANAFTNMESAHYLVLIFCSVISFVNSFINISDIIKHLKNYIQKLINYKYWFMIDKLLASKKIRIHK